MEGFQYNEVMYGKNLVKLFKSIDLLAQADGTSISELQEKLGITRRSVYRLLDTLKALNFPLEQRKSGDGSAYMWKLDPHYLESLPNISIKDLRLSREEIILLFFLFTRSNVFRETELEGYIASLKDKLDVFLPDNLRHPAAIAKLDDIFIPSGVQLGDYCGQEDILDDLTDSIVHMHRCIVTYHSFIYNEVKRFQIDPLKLFEHSGELYVFARVIDFDSISILTVRRIKQIAVIDQKFEFPDGFEPEVILDSASELFIGESVSARIWFSPELETYIKSKRWSPGQNIEDQPDGSIVLSVSTSGTLDVKKWVLSFGSQARVIEPKVLADAVEAEIERMRSSYREERR